MLVISDTNYLPSMGIVWKASQSTLRALRGFSVSWLVQANPHSTWVIQREACAARCIEENGPERLGSHQIYRPFSNRLSVLSCVR